MEQRGRETNILLLLLKNMNSWRKMIGSKEFYRDIDNLIC